jgi:hypothetical protein
MNRSVAALLFLVACIALLFVGGGQVAKGSNAQVANG